MALAGVTPFPPEFAARYRACGYWEDRPLIAHFLDAFGRFAERTAVIDEQGSMTYAELAAASQQVALNLLDLGLRPLDRVIVQLTSTRLFASFYFALQRMGAVPIMALPSHRYREISQFAALAGAVAAAAPATAHGTDFADLHRGWPPSNPRCGSASCRTAAPWATSRLRRRTAAASRALPSSPPIRAGPG